jgi:multidrug resistance efflux pump
MMLSAPPIGGGVLQITHLLRTGTVVKKGQIVLEFDPSEQQYKLEQSRSELLQAEQEITKGKADAAVQAAQDKVALLKARFDVRRAELDVGKNEMLSSIDAEKNNLALEQAKRTLAQLDQDIKSHTASGQATIALALEKNNKAQLAMRQARENIEKMRVRSPMDGVLAIEKNVDSTGGMFWGGISLPDYREGDQTQPGNNIASVIDPSDMEAEAKINERERGNVQLGQAVDIRLDAMPGQIFHGTVKSLAGMAVKNFWEDQAGGNFQVTIQVPPSDSRVRAGLTAQIVILGDKKKDVVYVPRQALFLRDGQRVAYVKNGSSFEAQEVKIKAEDEGRAVIEGLQPGVEVALLDPNAPKPSSESTSTPIGPSVGGSR